MDIAPVGTLSKATVVDAPANGAVTISEAGIATYQPKKDFFGTDSFTYSVEDADGNVSKATKVTVTVANVNDAPTVAPTGETLPTGQKSPSCQMLKMSMAMHSPIFGHRHQVLQ